MDTRTGIIHEMRPGETPEEFALRLGGRKSHFVAVARQADGKCSKCNGTGAIKKGLNSKRFKPCSCVLSLLLCLLLVGCGGTSWSERVVPTTDAERRAIAEHVERMLDTPYVMSGDDQDWEDVVDSTYREATILFVRKTYWEWYGCGMFDSRPSGYTGRWRYADETETKPPLAQSP